MDKILSDGTVLTKARFIRTTCKSCGKELRKDLIMNHYSWCNKKCKSKWVNKKHPQKGRWVKEGCAFDCDGNSI